MTNSIDGSDILMIIALFMIVYQVMNKNIFWTGIILLIIALIWASGINYYDKNKIKMEFR